MSNFYQKGKCYCIAGGVEHSEPSGRVFYLYDKITMVERILDGNSPNLVVVAYPCLNHVHAYILSGWREETEENGKS